ncbi:MAG: asparagine synthetase B, partial [Desulfobacterales bacterium]|nr:asparagine synthetase B [Desulfobacterales bacterium]
MCGIAGYASAPGNLPIQVEKLKHMANAMPHRGPDHTGIWHDVTVGIGLCHRRLSIIDLSPSGHQPMESPSQRYIIVYNGEIYNGEDIKNKLSEPIPWKGHSDTEIILAAMDEW